MRGERKEDSDTLIAMETHPDKSYGSIATDASDPLRDRNVFSDGSTRVDFVLVWEEPLHTKDSSESDPTHIEVTHKACREVFLKRLRRSGLLHEKYEVLQAKKKVCYVLLSAPWNVLCYYAEEISLRAPLQVVPTHIINWSERMLSKLSLPNMMSQDVPNPPPNYYTCQFRTNKLQRFLGSEDTETFFNTTQRHQVLYEILARTAYGSLRNGEVGIDRLVNEGAFTGAYPLHEGDFQLPDPPVSPKALGLRQILYSYWAQWSCWKCYQPLDHIRQYFGEKIALYFAWIGFYTGWLLPVSVLGTVIFLVGFWFVATDVPAEELCDSGGEYPMCPTCDICSYWNYSSICITYRVGLLFDNGGTVFFSVFMSLWAVTFLEYWKRTCSTLAHRWDCSEFEETEERPRPEFTAMAPMTVRNPVTGAEEPYFPEKTRVNRILTGCMVMVIMVTVVLIFLMAVILYRSILSVIIYQSDYDFAYISPGSIASLTGSVLNLLVILVLSKVYISLAHILTRWEMHRTQTEYENMYILKVFIFQFVNFYSTPIYIAFFKGSFVGYPRDYNTLFGVRDEDCGSGGCLIDLAQELLVIMVGKQLINNAQEFITPKLMSWWQKWRTRSELKEEGAAGEAQREEQQLAPWEADYQLLVCEGLFSEYLEMVIQFGFITIFVAACPVAPLFALINNWIEIRLDAQKFVTEYRRPVAERAQDIGIWFSILQFITLVAVLSNAFLIAFTSSFITRLFYGYTVNSTMSGYINFTLSTSPDGYNEQNNNTACRYRGFRDQNGDYLPEYYQLLAVQLTFVIVFEHFVFAIGRLIDLLVPDVPEDVQMKIRREHYMAKEALAENQVLGKTMIPADVDAPAGDLRHRGSRSTPPQSDSPPLNLHQIPEETDPPDTWK